MFARTSVVTTLLVLACAFGCKKSPKEEQPAAPPPQPNVVLITVDTLRADRLGCYGFEQARTPNIDRLAAEGVLVEHAIATVPITLPSHASILTGFYPPALGVRHNGRHTVPEEVETLAERLKRDGYRTQAFVSARVLHRRFNLDQGFDGYDDWLHGEGDAPTMFQIHERSAERTTDRVLQWLEQSPSSDAPFFLWVHLFDPHQPYEPPEEVARLSPTLYDGEIAVVDEQLGRLFRKLRELGKMDDTITVFTSDHGESLGEHGEETHAIFIYESTVHVPLIIRYPRKLSAGERYAGTVRGTDIMPTTIGLAGLEPVRTQGQDLTDALMGRGIAEVAAYSESLDAEITFAMAPLHGLRLGQWTYIRAPRAELYDRSEDPNELENLLERDDAVAKEAASKAEELDRKLSKILEESASHGFVAAANPLDRETIEMLKALGYMDESDADQGIRGMDPKDGIRAFQQMQKARRLALDGDCAETKKVLTSLLEWLPKNASARNLLAFCELDAGNASAAKSLYRESLAHDPRQPKVLTQLGRLALAEGKTASAQTRLEDALKVDPEYTDAMLILAYLDLKQGHAKKAASWYERAVAADPTNPKIYVHYGDFQFRKNDFVTARRWYEKALTIDPDHSRAALQTGMCALREGHVEAAKRYFERASRSDPDDWKALYNLACTQTRLGELGGARQSLAKARKVGLSDPGLVQRDPCFAPLRAN